MTVKQIEAHERKNRKGQYQSKGWRDDFDAMARKTVIRRLCGKYGLMSIDYQTGSRDMVNLAEAVMQGDFPETAADETSYTNVMDVDDSTGEVIGYGGDTVRPDSPAS